MVVVMHCPLSVSQALHGCMVGFPLCGWGAEQGCKCLVHAVCAQRWGRAVQELARLGNQGAVHAWDG